MNNKCIPLFLAILLLHSLCDAQQPLPVIKASSRKARIVEGKDDVYDWYLSPETRPDLHEVSKITKPKWVALYTDTDSIKVKLNPAGSFDFVVLLNGRDSCFTRFENQSVHSYARQNTIVADTIPFLLTAFNNILVSAVLNKTDTLDLKFDSGTTGLLLTNDAIKNKARSADLSRGDHSLQIGSLTWSKLAIYPVELSGQGTDGRFGWDLFDGRIVELDYDHNRLIIHPQLPEISRAYSRFNMEYTHSTFCISGELQTGNKTYRNRFLFDNGYQRTIMLDTTLMREQGYPADLPVIKKVIMQTGQGKNVPVITVNNERLNLKEQTLWNIPVQLMTTGNPAGFRTHILGNEVLKRFNTILDFRHNIVYLKPNQLMKLPYTDAQ